MGIFIIIVLLIAILVVLVRSKNRNVQTQKPTNGENRINKIRNALNDDEELNFERDKFAEVYSKWYLEAYNSREITRHIVFSHKIVPRDLPPWKRGEHILFLEVMNDELFTLDEAKDLVEAFLEPEQNSSTVSLLKFNGIMITSVKNPELNYFIGF